MKNQLLSLFQGYTDLRPTNTTLANLAEHIRTDSQLKACTDKHRYYMSKEQTRAALNIKAACPCFAVSVHFNGGKRKEHIDGWTHLVMADFDHIPAERMAECVRRVREDPHTLLAYTTISGEGLRVIAAYEASGDYHPRSEQELHVLAFRQMNEHYARLTGQTCDGKCKNCTRLSGLAHDPEAYFQAEATPFVIAKPQPEEHPAWPKAQRMKLARIVATAGRLLADEGIAYTEHHHNEYIMRMGYLLNAYGADQEAAIRWATKRFADYDGDVAGIVRSCYRRTEPDTAGTVPQEHGDRKI